MAENLATGLGLFPIVFQRVGHHEVHGPVHVHKVSVVAVISVVDGLVGALGVLDPELRGSLLVLQALIFAQFAVGLTHAVLDMLRTSRDVFCTQRAVLDLLLVLFLNTAYLVDVDTALHQLGDNLLARYATGILLHNVVHYLIVGHSRLSPSHGDCQHETGYHRSYSFHNNAYIIFIIKTRHSVKYCTKVHIFSEKRAFRAK